MNLEIRARILAEKDKIIKCCDCSAPVYDVLLPEKRFNEGYFGKPW